MKKRLVLLLLIISIILLMINPFQRSRVPHLVPGVPVHYVMPAGAAPVDYPNPFN